MLRIAPSAASFKSSEVLSCLKTEYHQHNYQTRFFLSLNHNAQWPPLIPTLDKFDPEKIERVPSEIQSCYTYLESRHKGISIFIGSKSNHPSRSYRFFISITSQKAYQ